MTRTLPSFSKRTHAWVYLVSFMGTAYGRPLTVSKVPLLVKLGFASIPTEVSQSMPHGTSSTTTGPATPASSGVKEQRVTKQRLAVSAALDELDDFVSTQELYRLMQNKGISVSLATAYRILQSLADDGLIDVLRNGEGEAVYRRCAVTGHHHHLLCRNCGKAVEVEAPPSRPGLPALPRSTASPRLRTRLKSSGSARSALRRKPPESSKALPQVVPATHAR